VGWLEVEKDGLAVVHFDRHISKSAKTRAVDAKRQSRKRAKTCHGTSVTLSSSSSSSLSSLNSKEMSSEKTEVLTDWVRFWNDIGLMPSVKESPNAEIVRGFAAAWADPVRHEFLTTRRCEVFAALEKHRDFLRDWGPFVMASLFGRVQGGNWFEKVLNAYWPDMQANPSAVTSGAKAAGWRNAGPKSDRQKALGEVARQMEQVEHAASRNQNRLEDKS
jgi:hypothetical protein